MIDDGRDGTGHGQLGGGVDGDLVTFMGGVFVCVCLVVWLERVSGGVEIR